MRFLSLFSGIEAASAAWVPIGWQCVGVSEIDTFGCAALAHHHPHVPNLGDVKLAALCATYLPENMLDIAARYPRSRLAARYLRVAEIMRYMPQFDVLVFGSPCQDLSVAGKRKGFDGERSSLFFAAMRIVRWARKRRGLRWAVWENVPGAYSSNDGRDFAAVVGELAGMDAHPDVPPRGWGTEGAAVGETGMVEWSCLDAQWFGVAQRRRRVFAVADFGDWANRPPVLLESESLRGDSAPQRGAREDVAVALAAGAAGGDRQRELVLNTNAEGSTGHPFLTVSNLSKTVNNQTPLLVFGFNMRQDPDSWLDRAGPLDTFSNTQGVATFTFAGFKVRRLTPTECERLQGFAEGHTAIPLAGKPAADTPRYRSLGNSMCVKVMRWIGRSIEFAHHY